MTYRLECRLTASIPIADAFEVFKDPHNLERITPPWLNFRIVTPHVTIRQGAEIAYVIRWLGIPMKWKTVITRFDPPHAFIDEQARGPYTLWRHQHFFEETPAGTVISDQVDYRLPLGILGRIAHAAMVKHQLLAIFRYRQKAIAGLLNVPGISFDNPQVSRSASQ